MQVIAHGDAMDDIEAVLEILQHEEQGLRFGDEPVDFLLHDARVLDVLVQEGAFGEPGRLEGRQDSVADERSNEALGVIAKDQVVEHALGPAGRGEDVVDGAADVRVEALQIVRSDAGRLDKVVEFEPEFVLGV